jgi:pyocin large subunit-like protein
MDWEAMNMKTRVVFLIGAGALALVLAACDAGPSATSKAPQAARAGSPAAAAQGAGGASAGGGQTAAADPRDAPIPVATDGKPLWAANRQHTAQENADYQFGRNGKDFNATTEAEYVAKAHAFIDAPPAGIKRVERSNGDALLYDARTNTFAVATSAGAPRTMFKPRDGASYWQQQVDREADRVRKGGDNSQS